jgi:hypothetical protein
MKITLWITPDHEAIAVGMECTAYSGDIDPLDS